MKNTILYGLLGFIISFTICLSIILLMDSIFFSIDILFCIPVGYVFIGYFACKGFNYGIVKDNLPYNPAYRIHLIFMLYVIGYYFLIHYASYFMARIEDGFLVYNLTGDHISNYILEGYGLMNFSKYMRLISEPYSYRFIIFDGPAEIEVSSLLSESQVQESYNIENIFTLLQMLTGFIGFMFGGVLAAVKPKTMKWCEKCKNITGRNCLPDLNESFLRKKFMII